ncbi:MAG: ATP-binding cassette domain-containing protein [Agathobacter rectalis]
MSFTVQKGQTIGIIGGTGSGKSSLVNLIQVL